MDNKNNDIRGELHQRASRNSAESILEFFENCLSSNHQTQYQRDEPNLHGDPSRKRLAARGIPENTHHLWRDS